MHLLEETNVSIIKYNLNYEIVNIYEKRKILNIIVNNSNLSQFLYL